MGRIEYSGQAGFALFLTAMFSVAGAGAVFVGLFQGTITNLVNQVDTNYTTVTRFGNYTAGNGTTYARYYAGYDYQASLPTLVTLISLLIVYAIIAFLIIRGVWGLAKRATTIRGEKTSIRFTPTRYQCKFDGEIGREYWMENHMLQKHADLTTSEPEDLDDIES